MTRAKSRDTYKYEFKVGNKVVYVGTTKDISRREKEHKKTWPKGQIVQVGRRTTEKAARNWEADNIRVVQSSKYTRSGNISRSQVSQVIKKGYSSKTTTVQESSKRRKKP
jgi:predicted GIY-YIG superfamily endonuclease